MVRAEVVARKVARASAWLADASATFDVLAERGAIDRDLATAMRAAVGVRNRIAHGHAGVDHVRLHAEASSGVADVERFLAAIAAAAAA
ncbi:MAG: DUF86 domain-containing protein [Deltaproteobacteria bacterium]|nr:DUF86 domain-containing protein [Deltaproteobacteria bacterium]